MRVIAGAAKGRALVVPRGQHIRPTTDRVKAAVFSMLEAQAVRRREPVEDFPFARVLDLFAGTGALGIEALSRGANHADFVEADRQALAALEENLRRTGFRAQATIHARRVEQALPRCPGPYDVIFADPPYDDPGLADLLEALGRPGMLAPEGIFMLESSRRTELPAKIGLLLLDRVRYHGASAVSLYRLSA